MQNILISGGTVLDGTGAKGFRADVRVRGGRIAEVGTNLRAGDERVIDAGGAYVAPGFIDAHTHYDGPMWWMPSLDPLPSYGSTTAVMGNCGLSVAPMAADPADQQGMIGIFSFLEDIPRHTFERCVPWGWQSWPQYSAALRKQPTGANIGAFIGHINLRISVMGAQAWDRAATADECARMAAMLEEGLRCGALGLSTNFFDKDGDERPVPSRRADKAEFEALLDVMARYPAVILQLMTNIGNPTGILQELQYVTAMCAPRGVRMQFLQLPISETEQGVREELLAYMEQVNTSGGSIWAGYQIWPANVSLNFERTILFSAFEMHAWDELANKTPTDRKVAVLSDPDWRAKARLEWDAMHPASFLRRKLYLNGSENQVGPTDKTLQEYAELMKLHPSDALADWVIKNGAASTVRIEPRKIDDGLVAQLARNKHTLTGVNDAGAHCQLFCGAGASAYLLTHFVRDTGLLSIEEAVHSLTGQIAGHFSFADRGVIAPGKIADIGVFALGELAFRDEERIRDVPDGDGDLTWRFTRQPGPFRATLVRGVPSFENGAYTGELPGRLIGPGPEHAEPRAT